MADIITAIKSKAIFGGLPVFKKLDSWSNWLVALKAAFALPMDASELEVYRKYTGRQAAPVVPPRELWFIVGRRGGKSFMAALVAVFLGVFVRWPLGLEKGYIMCVACDRRQASVVFNYIKRILELPAFKALVAKELAEEIWLSNNVVLAVQTSSYRAVRGFQVIAVVLDETGLMRSEFTANPVGELLTALRPSLGSIPGSRLISISTGFQRSGPMWEVFRDKYGVDDPETLVWAASTSAMNQNYSRAVIDKALKDDYQSAAVEYGEGIFFRADLEGYLSQEALEAVIVPGRFELPPQKGVDYVAGVDTSGGRGDASVLSICHKSGDKVVQDLVRGWYPPFNPADCVKEFATIVKEYHIHSVTGDKYAAGFHSGAWLEHGIEYKNAELTKSDYYIEFLPLVMRRGCELLDNKRQSAEFRQLLRRTGRGKDSVDHPPNGSDDHSNACALSVVEAAKFEADATFVGLLSPNVWPEGSGYYEAGGGTDEYARMMFDSFRKKRRPA